MSWLADLELRQGLQVSQLSIDVAEAPGQVAARILWSVVNERLDTRQKVVVAGDAGVAGDPAGQSAGHAGLAVV
ncbi:hypothetical protein UMZ34_17965 [Halopseudomonas pachastrellae]|nr:hypothetical protein UMZ34_17965 [Halopseudomonas pachastrellae]